MTLAQPTIYSLETDFVRFGLTWAEAQTLMSKRFENRRGVKQGDERAIVYHIQDGSTIGSLRWWLPRQASATVMIQRDGSILKVIPEQHGPWTNGDVKSPLPEAKPLLDLGDNPNIWSLTIEAEGGPFDAMPQVQKDAIAWQTIDWMTRYPKITIDWIFRHGWINSVDRINCGLYIDDILPIVRRELGSVPTHSLYPAGMDEGIAEMLFGSEFNPKGPISRRWIDRGKLTGLWPKYLGKKQFDDRTYFTFSDGWVLWRVGTGPIVELK